MKRYLLIFPSFLAGFSSFSSSAEARLQSFTGVYVGGSFGYTNVSTKIRNTKTDKEYKLTGGGTTYSFVGGMGKAWKRFYLGYEGSVGYNNGRAKKNGGSVGSNFQFGFAVRFGSPIPEASSMPYISLGLQYRQMDFKTDTTSNFYNYSLVPSVGTEFIINEQWRMRMEGGYQVSLRTTNLPGGYKFKSKPSGFVVSGTATYKFEGTS